MKTSELRAQSVDELRGLEQNLLRELFELRSEMLLSDQPKQPHRVAQKRRLRARALTIIGEKMKTSEK